MTNVKLVLPSALTNCSVSGQSLFNIDCKDGSDELCDDHCLKTELNPGQKVVIKRCLEDSSVCVPVFGDQSQNFYGHWAVIKGVLLCTKKHA